MKNLIPILYIAIVSFFLHQFTPWWTPGLVALCFGAIYNEMSSLKSFSMGFLAIFLLWAIWSIYSNSVNDGILSSRIGDLLGVLNGFSVIVITALIGGLLGGLGAVAGKLSRDALS